MRRALKLLAVLPFVVAAAIPARGGAQEATPPPGSESPGPEDCRVAPRSPQEIVALLATPAAPPATPPGGLPAPGGESTVASEAELPVGEPADAATAAALAATMREGVACANAGDFFRVFALLSDDAVRGVATERTAAEVEEELATAAATPAAPATAEERVMILALRDARVFADGRAGIVLVTDQLDSYGGPTTSLAILVRVGERWLLDGSIEVDPDAE